MSRDACDALRDLRFLKDKGTLTPRQLIEVRELTTEFNSFTEEQRAEAKELANKGKLDDLVWIYEQ